eukprot:scaffold142250_cov48-Attheya_sp.AAC.1
MFNALKEYKSEHGDMMVPTVYTPNLQLANFVQRMRNLYSSYENGPPPKGLIKARFELLEKEGFVWDVHQLNWDVMYDKFKEYVEEHGDSCVPSRYEHDPQLGQWVLTQRNTYKTERHKSDPTFAERVERLEKLNFVWYQQEATWMERFDELKKYKAETGDCLVPQRWLSNEKLAQWERIELLESLDFAWDARDVAWQRRYEDLEEFVKLEGHTTVPYLYKGIPGLGRWAKQQRVYYVKKQNQERNPLTDERQEALERVGFVWTRRIGSREREFATKIMVDKD